MPENHHPIDDDPIDDAEAGATSPCPAAHRLRPVVGRMARRSADTYRISNSSSSP